MTARATPTFLVQRAGERACFDHGWLQTCHSFSFADYHDPNNVNWGALRVLNDDVVQPGQGFPTHPHRDMEIVTYVLAGRLEHRDSTGSHGVVGPGGAQYMSAGTGVRHSEYNHSKTEPLHFLQMWVIPGKLGIAPAYGQVEFEERDRLNRWLTVASGRPAVDAPVRLTQDAAFYVTRLAQGRHLEHRFDPGRLGFAFVAEGAVRLGEERLASGDAARIAGLERLAVTGDDGLLVLWDVPPQ
ncbi:MAG: pirin family protein [Candidatus Eremiobacteraeota bacterium]|nr:pirin family protein [Candidatus Eremiobacteraeota bacterium]